MKIIKSKSNKKFVLIAEFNNENAFGQIIENASNSISTIFLGKKSEFTVNKLSKVIEILFLNSKRSYEIMVSSFQTNIIKEEEVVRQFIEQNILINGKKFSKKTCDKKIKQTYSVISKKMIISDFSETILLATQMSFVRYFQNMPANLCTIDFLTNELKGIFSNSKKVKTNILTKNDLEKLGMNLILSVNEGSKQNAKVIVCEYNNNPSSKKKIAIIGKGIIFDSGGYDLKRGKNMLGMKYDMSGAVVAAYILDTIDKLNLKTNVSIVLPITDNLVDSNATLPESIITSMSGKTVEIANTDAEGRLILADGLTYASRELKASLLIDISTLTGSVIYALGHLYTGVWSSTDKNWNLIEKSAKHSNEKVWRMPLDSDYDESLSKKTFADVASCSNTEYSDCNIAASWLYSFADNKEYIHFDIAGTADINENGKSPMIKTIVEFVKNY